MGNNRVFIALMLSISGLSASLTQVVNPSLVWEIFLKAKIGKIVKGFQFVKIWNATLLLVKINKIIVLRYYFILVNINVILAGIYK